MLILVLSLLVAGMLALFAYVQAKTRNMKELSERIPGPKLVPIIGNVLEFGFKTEGFFSNVNRIVDEYGPITRFWLGTELLILVAHPKYFEVIINSNKYIDKAYFYRFLFSWLGTGLLTSKGNKWRSHRKLITPAFHFIILEQFVDVFSRNGHILLEQLAKHVNGPEFDIFPYIKLYVLDVISESTMGVSVNAQRNRSSDYIKAVEGISEVFMQRSFKPWLQPDWMFRLTSLAKTESESLAVLHGMSTSVIAERKREISQKHRSPDFEGQDIGRKRRLAFLDLLIEASQDGAALTDEEIREEVDTFIFEGHDTTASGISFTLWALAKHQDVQEKVISELKAIFGDSDREAKFSDLQEMKYLEQVVKESLRLYPSVPLFGRVLTEDVSVEGYVLPAGCNVVFETFTLHRNPEYFPHPEKFDPDRFLPENTVNRHPYSYIPFAAGPRNCVGQKFAMLEIKATVAKLLRNYRVLTDRHYELRLVLELVLKSADGIKLRLEPRKW